MTNTNVVSLPEPARRRPSLYRRLEIPESAGYDAFVAPHQSRDPRTWAGLLRLFFDDGRANGRPKLSTLSGNYWWALVGRRSRNGTGDAFLPWMEENKVLPADCNQAILNRFRIDLERNDVRKATLGNYMRPINTFVNWCKREGYLPEPGVLKNIYRKQYREGTRVEKPLRDSEIRELLISAWDGQRERDYLLIALLGMCGLRAGEIESITMDNIRRDHKGVWQLTIGVAGEIGKTSGSSGARVIDLPSVPPLPGRDSLGRQLFDYAAQLPKATLGRITSGPIFCGFNEPYRPLSVRHINQIIKRAKREAEHYRKVQFRGSVSSQLLRKSYVTRQLIKGQTMEQISRYVGNSKVIGWDFYARHLPAHNQSDHQHTFNDWGQDHEVENLGR